VGAEVAKIIALGGLLGTWAAIIGLLVRSRGMAVVREFASLVRPTDLDRFPLVSIIVPARDEERNIGPCLESLLSLDYPRFEILVVDDHSTDQTAQIVIDLAARQNSPAAVLLFRLRELPQGPGAGWLGRKSLALWEGGRLPLGVADWKERSFGPQRQYRNPAGQVVMGLSRNCEVSPKCGQGMVINPGRRPGRPFPFFAEVRCLRGLHPGSLSPE
jgi:hypothetical protein